MIILKIFILLVLAMFALGLLAGVGTLLGLRQLQKNMGAGAQRQRPADPNAIAMQQCPVCGMYVEATPHFDGKGRCDQCGKVAQKAK